MPLFWIVHRVDGKPSVFIQEASTMVYARMKAGLSGHGGAFVEAHQLERTMKVPKAMTGRPLSGREARALLKRIG